MLYALLLGHLWGLLGQGSNEGVPGGGFAIVTEQGAPLYTESDNVLVLESHP